MKNANFTDSTHKEPDSFSLLRAAEKFIFQPLNSQRSNLSSKSPRLLTRHHASQAIQRRCSPPSSLESYQGENLDIPEEVRFEESKITWEVGSKELHRLVRGTAKLTVEEESTKGPWL